MQHRSSGSQTTTASTIILEQENDETDTATTTGWLADSQPTSQPTSQLATASQPVNQLSSQPDSQPTSQSTSQLASLRHIQPLSENKGKQPALLDHLQPDNIDHSRPSSSRAHVPKNESTSANSSDSDKVNVDHRYADLFAQYARSDGFSVADWIAQQHNTLQEVEIPTEVLEGETLASQQLKWKNIQHNNANKAKRIAAKEATKQVNKDKITSWDDIVETAPGFQRSRIRTRSTVIHFNTSHKWDVYKVPAASTSPTAPQDHNLPKKGKYTNPPGSQQSTLLPSSFPLPEESLPLQHFVLPKTIIESIQGKPTEQSMETSSDEES